MVFRLIVGFLLLLSTAIRVSATSLYPLDDSSLQQAVEEIRKKNYGEARDLALKGKPAPAKNFILGVANYRIENWSEAAELFSASAEGFPLLADYSLYYLAESLVKLNKYDQALDSLRKLKKHYPESPMTRVGSYLFADTLFRMGDYSEALKAYQKYVESYPSGAKSIEAAFQTALCRLAIGERETAVAELRGIWLRYPVSPVASKAEEELNRLVSEKVPVMPYSAEEMFGRASVLYDLGKTKNALAAFRSIDEKDLPASTKDRLNLKIGQALFRTKQYREAESVFRRLAATEDNNIAMQASYWLARTLHRSGQVEEAAKWYAGISASKSNLAADSLFYLATIARDKGEKAASIATFEKTAAAYPASTLAPKALWEAAWTRYQIKDYAGAAVTLSKLTDHPDYREKALYWLARANQATGRTEAADTFTARLLEEYPHGFYATQINRGKDLNLCRIASDEKKPSAPLPIPAGYDRAKALITFGMIDEARTELARYSKKSGRLLDIARLYWEIPDYRSAMALFAKVSGSNELTWNYSYPKAFSEHVEPEAETCGVPESLAYSIIRAESNFHPTALSPVGAVGLMQLMPSTAKIIHKSGKIESSELKQPALNISLGMRHIKGLIRQFDDNLVLAVAAYNSGATPVNRWRKAFSGLQEDEFIESIPYWETREYVKKVMTSMAIYKSLYNLDAPETESAEPGAPAEQSGGEIALSGEKAKATQHN